MIAIQRIESNELTDNEHQQVETWAIQSTTKEGVSTRKLKLAAIKWPTSWLVSIVHIEKIRVGRAVEYSWHLENLTRSGWQKQTPIKFNHKELK